jgi:chromosome segregation ATPase
MASATKKTSCESCGEHVDTFKCTKCDKVFCFLHLQAHREEVVQQIQIVHDELNATYARIDHLKQNMTDHPLMQTINQWENDSINKIQMLAQDTRQTLTNCLTENMSQIEHTWKKMANDIKNSSEKKNFDETHVNQWNEELNQLKTKINQPVNGLIRVREDSTPLINTLRVYFDG